MAERVFIGNDNGAFKFRVSKAGQNARSAAVEDLILYEGMQCFSAYEEGTHVVGAGGNLDVGLTRFYASPPFLILRCAENYLPGPRTFFASMRISSQAIRLSNRMWLPLTIKYCIFAEN